MCSRAGRHFICTHRHQLSYILRRKVSTWSHLGAAFNSLPNKRMNLNLGRKSTGLFGIDLLASPEGFLMFRDGACGRAHELIAEALSTERARKMVDVFDDLSDELCKVADLSEFIRVGHPEKSYREASEDACLHINKIVETLNTHRELYDSLRNVVENGDKMPTTEVDKHVSELFLFDFEQSGIHLPVKERDKVVSLNENILNLGQLFTVRAGRPQIVPKSSVPELVRQHFASIENSLIIYGLYADSPNEMTREYAYKLYLKPDPQQEFVLDSLLKARHDLATICGFPTYADRAIKSTVANTPEFVDKFLERLNVELRPKTESELRFLANFKASQPHKTKEVNPWDMGYLTAKVRNNYLQLDVSEVNAYFSLGACMEGLNNLTEKLFGISLVCEEVQPQECWSPDVYRLAVVHESEGLLGHIYCDFYQRNGKPNQDSHFTIRGGRQLRDGSYQNPIVVLLLNLQVPQWSSPCLLSPGQLDNLLHEMGHALHSMLARTKHQHVTGTRCCTDFAEVPSILMEYFISDPRVLKTFAKHFQTKEPMPDEIVQKICDSKHILNATETQTQVLYSALDQRLHGKHPLGKPTGEIYQQLQEEYSLLRPVKDTAWYLRFSHLVGYGAKYYSYLLSKSIASCIWQTYFKDDPFSRQQGEKYRQECLRHGGGKPARQLLNDFLNKEPSPHTMADALVSEIDQYRNLLQKDF